MDCEQQLQGLYLSLFCFCVYSCYLIMQCKSLGLNILFHLTWKGIGQSKDVCHSPLPHNGYTCIEIIIYSHNTFTLILCHTHVHSHQRDTMLPEIKSLWEMRALWVPFFVTHHFHMRKLLGKISSREVSTQYIIWYFIVDRLLSM